MLPVSSGGLASTGVGNAGVGNAGGAFVYLAARTDGLPGEQRALCVRVLDLVCAHVVCACFVLCSAVSPAVSNVMRMFCGSAAERLWRCGSIGLLSV